MFDPVWKRVHTVVCAFHCTFKTTLFCCLWEGQLNSQAHLIVQVQLSGVGHSSRDHQFQDGYHFVTPLSTSHLGLFLIICFFFFPMVTNQTADSMDATSINIWIRDFHGDLCHCQFLLPGTRKHHTDAI